MGQSLYLELERRIGAERSRLSEKWNRRTAMLVTEGPHTEMMLDHTDARSAITHIHRQDMFVGDGNGKGPPPAAGIGGVTVSLTGVGKGCSSWVITIFGVACDFCREVVSRRPPTRRKCETRLTNRSY